MSPKGQDQQKSARWSEETYPSGWGSGQDMTWLSRGGRTAQWSSVDGDTGYGSGCSNWGRGAENQWSLWSCRTTRDIGYRKVSRHGPVWHLESIEVLTSLI